MGGPGARRRWTRASSVVVGARVVQIAAMKDIGDTLTVIVCAILAFGLAAAFIWDVTHGGGYNIAASWAR